MTTTLTGPRSFRATITKPEVRQKYTGALVAEAETFTYDASDATSKPAQRALFADYTSKAKELGYKLPRAESWPKTTDYGDGRGYVPSARFTAPPIAANERKWLGREVGFKPAWAHTFVPVGDGVRTNTTDVIRGTVWSLSAFPAAFWVYVEGQGFYSVNEDNFLVGVNA